MRHTQKKLSEHDEQCLIFEWAQTQERRWPALKYMYSSLVGVNLGARLATQAKRSGSKKGRPDIHLPCPIGKYHGLFIELKIPGGKTSPEQKDYISFLKSQGYYADVRVGSKEAIDLIIDYMEGLL